MLYETKNISELHNTICYKSISLKNTDVVTVESDQKEDGTVLATFRITDSSIDRAGDRIISGGVKTDKYEKYGSLIWEHSSSHPDFILGRPVSVKRTQNHIDMTFKFASEEANPLGHRVGKMVKEGLISNVSVGIKIEEYEETKRKGFYPIDVTKSELIEVSLTVKPMNSNATIKEITTEENKNIEEVDKIAEAFVSASKNNKQINDALVNEFAMAIKSCSENCKTSRRD